MNIDLDQIHEIAQKGVRRAAAFLALGVNAARDSRLVEYQFPNDAFIRILPEGLSKESIEHLKQEYEKWVILAGLRELIETFGVYLDAIHNVALVISSSTIGPIDLQKNRCSFELSGTTEKLSTLKKRFNIHTQKEKYLASVSRVRNCLAHRRGIVGQKDVDENGVLKVTWWTLDVFAETPKGEQISLKPPLPNGGVIVEAGGTIKARFTDHELQFNVGQVVELTISDLSEICLLVSLAAKEILASITTFARNNGISVITTNTKENNQT